MLIPKKITTRLKTVRGTFRKIYKIFPQSILKIILGKISGSCIYFYSIPFLQKPLLNWTKQPYLLSNQIQDNLTAEDGHRNSSIEPPTKPTGILMSFQRYKVIHYHSWLLLILEYTSYSVLSQS